MEPGGVLNFEAVPVFPQGEASAAWLKNWETQEGVLLFIQFRGQESHRIDGSAVMVAPGIALCASHVIAPHLERLVAGEVGAICSGITSSGLLIWRICKVTCIDGSDFTILGLELASNLPNGNLFRQGRISTRVPEIGENVVLLGFRAEESVEQIEEKRFHANGNVLMCQGKVSARYDAGRDRVFIPWPVIEVACPSWGGMSGGPAFDKNGNLIGLITSSIESDEATGPSYVSQIWPALTASFEGGWPAVIFQGKRSLLEIDPRFCAIDGRENLEVIQNPDGTAKVRFRIEPT